MDLYDEFRTLVEALNEARVPYALCGGMAMAVHDVPRATVDIDLMVSEAGLEGVVSVARELGFTLDSGELQFRDGDIRIRRLLKPDPEAGDSLVLDLLLVTPATRSAWESRTVFQLEWGPVSVVGREGLVELKALRDSGRDRDDIARLRGEGDDT